MIDFSYIAILIIYICIFLLLYSFFLYPLLTIILAKIFTSNTVSNINEVINEPDITVIISAYNEEELIADAIHSIFNSNYPNDKITLMVGSDGSNDKTFNIISELAKDYEGKDFCLKVYDLPRTGKNGVVNKLSKLVTSDYIFYMDADCRIDKLAINKMINKLSDPNIGAVIASMESENIGDDNAGAKGEGMYQQYEQILRINESKISSTVISLGAFYGIKRKYYKPLPNNNVCDDWMSLLFIAMEKKKIIFLSDAIVREVRGKNIVNEFKRRVRISAGALSTLLFAKKLFLPKYGWFAFALFSHRLLRYLAPIFMLKILILTLFVSNSDIFLPLVLTQGIFYILAILGKLASKFDINIPIVKIFYYFVAVNTAQFLAIFHFLKNNNISIWDND